MDTPINFFSIKLRELGFGSYEEYLQSDIWQQFRKRYFNSKKKGLRKTCVCCRTAEWNVELHHKTYQRLGSERLNDVIPLCRKHHERVHELLNEWYGGAVEFTNQIIARIAPRGKKGSSRGRTLRKGKKRL